MYSRQPPPSEASRRPCHLPRLSRSRLSSPERSAPALSAADHAQAHMVSTRVLSLGRSSLGPSRSSTLIHYRDRPPVGHLSKVRSTGEESRQARSSARRSLHTVEEASHHDIK